MATVMIEDEDGKEYVNFRLYHFVAVIDFLLYSAMHTDVIIGFDPDSYSVDEEAGVVTFVVRVLEGSLMVPVTVRFSTIDGLAMSE